MELLTLGLAVEALRATDVDGDGVHELVASGRERGHTVLEVVDGDVQRVDLGDRAAWWDAAHGVWVVDGQGLVRVDTGERVAELPTALAYLGPSLPAAATIVVDVDGDHRPELVVWSAGQLVVVEPDGTELGRVPLPAVGQVSSAVQGGGMQLGASLSSPSFAVQDADGDGLRDVLVVQGDELVVHFTGERVGERTSTWSLPERLDDPLFQDREAYRFVTDVHFRDVNGDQRVDLVLQRVLSDGSLLSTETEIRVHLGTGSGFGPASVLTIDGGASDVYPADLDGDGDQELVSLRLDLDAAGLAQSVFDQRVPVALVAWTWDDGYGPMTTVKSLRAPVSEGGASWNLFGDMDGDGRADLAVHREGRIRVWAGPDFETVLHDQTVSVPVDELLMADLTGDGTAELVGWARGQRTLVVLGR